MPSLIRPFLTVHPEMDEELVEIDRGIIDSNYVPQVKDILSTAFSPEPHEVIEVLENHAGHRWVVRTNVAAGLSPIQVFHYWTRIHPKKSKKPMQPLTVKDFLKRKKDERV